MTWEERMASRARERAVVEGAERHLEQRAAFNAIRCTVSDYLDRMDVTYEDAVYLRNHEPVLCACMGPPPEVSEEPDPPCRCALLYMKVEQLLGPA